MGKIFDIQRFSVHDGPGIRTTVFMKGCPLRCLWCHNPESQPRERSIAYRTEKCVGCGACATVCEHHKIVDGKHVFDRTNCVRCGKCAEKCNFDSLEAFGRAATVEEVIKEVMKDKTFYKTSDGGVTFSGGEPFYQSEFLLEMLKAAKAEGLHTCIETCGFTASSAIKEALPYVDLFLFDFKESDEERHKELTGVPLEPILNNLRLIDENGGKTVLRCPIIPSVNLSEEHLNGIAKIAASLTNLTEVNVMAYHTLGNGKYTALDMRNPLPDLPAMTDAEKKECIAKLSERIAKLTDKKIKVC